MDHQEDELLSKVQANLQAEQPNSTKVEDPYTWTQIAKGTIPKFLLVILVYHVGCGAALAYYSLGLNSVPVKWWTVLWAFVVGLGASFSVTAGAHRLWAHRAYKAKLPLRIWLMIMYSASGMNPLYYWIRDHRVHHKYSETDADPHSAKRGFFFSHVGWLFMKRHPDCIRRGKEIDMSDIEADPLVMFQTKYAYRLQLIFCYIIPAVIPVTMWNETILNAILTQWFIRQVLVINMAASVNSFAHLWGTHPYNRFINPAENHLVSLIAMGEGSHNYHHTFPWDYKTSEFPYFNFNCTTLFIDAMAKIGWAYDLRQTSPESIDKVVRRIGCKSQMSRAN